MTRFFAMESSDQFNLSITARRIPQKKFRVKNGMTSGSTARNSFSVSSADIVDTSPFSSVEFSVLIVSGSLRLGFGFVPILYTLSVFETDDAPVIIAIRLCGVSDFE
jgi:hypothetical protein